MVCRKVKTYLFTLIELMVICSMIIVLVSFLVPALKVSKEKMKDMQCKANLRQMGIAAIGYNSDFGSMMAQGRHNYARRGYLWSSDRQSAIWSVFTQQYLGASDSSSDGDYGWWTQGYRDRGALRFYAPDVLQCPFNPFGLVTSSNDIAKGRVTNTKGMNYHYFGGSTYDFPISISTAESLLDRYELASGRSLGSSVALFGDSSDTGPPGSGSYLYTDSSHRVDGAPDNVSSIDEGAQNLRDGNVVYGDGRVSSSSITPLQDKTWAEDSWCYRQTGWLPYPASNPTTALYPLTDGSGNLRSNAIVTGPFVQIR